MSSSKSESEGGSYSFQFRRTPDEYRLRGINMDIVEAQLKAIRAQMQFQQKALGAVLPTLQGMTAEQQAIADLFTPEERRDRMLAQVAQQDKWMAAQDELLQRELERIRQGPGATEEQRALINEATEAQIRRGESDIQAFGENAIDMIRNQLAPSRGLRPTDTPIQDRAFEVGGEMSRQQGQLISSLRGGQAQAELNFPLAANAQQAAMSQFQQQLGQSSQDFQQQLQQQAFQNRLNLFGQVGQLGLGLSGVQPAANLQQAFKPQMGTFQEQSTDQGSGWGMISSRELKHANRAIDEAVILEALMSIPVEKWKYIYPEKNGHGVHIGPYAEDFQRAFGIGDGKTISYTDAIGVLMAAVQALSREVEELKNGNSQARDSG
jgi:hypothetical protein